MSDSLVVRPLTEAQMPRFLETDNIAFLEGPMTPEMQEWSLRRLEVERSIGVFDGDAQVGGASIFTLRMTVPEHRRVPLAGVTWVGILPTHRRRGGLRAMMRHQLHNLHETGAEPVAGLQASQAQIYGRFGYGLATRSYRLTVPRHANALRLPEGVDDVRVTLVDPKSALDSCKAVYERQLLRRPGMMDKPDWWDEFKISDLPEMRGSMSSIRFLLAERDGAPVGYATYRTNAGAESEVVVKTVYADDAAAYAALYRVLLNIDLSHTAVFEHCPTDAPLLFMLEDPRSARPSLCDDLYIRLVDVERAMTSRTYATAVDDVFEVIDDFCPWNAGRWRLSGDDTGAIFVRTDDPADLTLNVRELGSLYLGGTTLRSLADAGLVQEHTPRTVQGISSAFVSDAAPFLPLGI